MHDFISSRTSSKNNITIDLRTSISKIKQLLVEGGEEMMVSFKVPDIFFLPPNEETSSQELHLMMV